jgi:hypothetical protein
VTTTNNAICGLDLEGSLYCWRFNNNGEYGNGGTGALLDTAAVAAASGQRFSVIAGGPSFLCGLDGAGSPWCWGSNSEGQLGDGTTSDHYLPKKVTTSLSFSALMRGEGVLAECALTAEGRAYCWGSSYYGQVGDGNGLRVVTNPVRVLLIR